MSCSISLDFRAAEERRIDPLSPSPGNPFPSPSLARISRPSSSAPLLRPTSRSTPETLCEYIRVLQMLVADSPTDSSIKIGSTSVHTPAQLQANLLALIPQLAVRIPNSDFSNIQSLNIKTSTSIALPIYNTTLDTAGRFAGPSKDETDAIAKRQAEKDAAKAEQERKEAEREERRKERSATREGKGRAEKEKKRKAPASDDGEDKVVVEEETIPLTKPIVEASESPAPKKKSKTAPATAEVKVKKSKKVKA